MSPSTLMTPPEGPRPGPFDAVRTVLPIIGIRRARGRPQPPTEPATDLAATPSPSSPTIDWESSEADRWPDPIPSAELLLERGIGRRYCLEREIGRGGFGVVFLAYDRTLHRQVAIKVASTGPGRGVEQLREEGRKVAQLDHPNVVPVYDCGRVDDRMIFIVSKYVDGGSLARQMALRKLPIDEAVRIAAQVAEGLAHAHQRGLIHRDLKPSNILVDARGNVYVADFGLALRATDRSDQACVEGSPLYMSPEQATGKSRLVDRRTDVFSFGIILYEMLTGRRPFPAKSAPEFRAQVIHLEPDPPRALDPGIPEPLERICLKAMAKDPGRRYASAWELARDLRAWDTAPGRAPRPGRAATRLSLAAAATMLLLTASLLLWAARSRASEAPLAPGPITTAPPAPEPIPAPSTFDRPAAELVVGLGGKVDFETYPASITSVEQLPTEPAALRSIDLHQIRAITAEDLELIGRLPALENLHLSDTGITDDDLAPLSGLVRLEMLWLSWNDLTDRGIVHLRDMDRLEHLNLERTLITDTGVEILASARDLTLIDLSETRITDGALRFLGGLPRLRTLRLNRTAVTDSCVGDLLRMRGLQRLEARGTALSDRAVAILKAGLPRCEVLR